MPTVRCSVCNNAGLLAYVTSGLDRGLSNAGIAAGLESAGGHLDPDVVGRHKKAHWKPKHVDGAPQPTKRDLAIMLRDRVAAAVEEERPRTVVTITEEGISTEQVPFNILDKELAPALSMGLKAQATLDKRELEKNRLGLAAGALGFQMYLAGLGRDDADVPELDDGLTIDGEAEEIE